MVRLDCSEFTFGYAFLYEQTLKHRDDLVSFPVLPSLREEKNTAWDAHLPLRGIDYYYQFKISDYLSRSNAKYIKEGYYSAPYYRIRLHPANRNQQHSILRQLSTDANKKVYYVSPEFHDKLALTSAFLKQNLTNYSRLIPLSECDDINDSEQHYITYQENDPNWTQWSRPKKHKFSFSGKELEIIYREDKKDWVDINLEYAQSLLDSIKKLVSVDFAKGKLYRAIEDNWLQEESNNLSIRSALMKVSYVVAVVFGVTLVLVGERPRSNKPIAENYLTSKRELDLDD
ncbi:MAG: hypothetical protein JXA81_15180 [Sedimentisphaerales bacterium]|nr:hypothetical protein [Sedimentisphaerales bacterium]